MVRRGRRGRLRMSRAAAVTMATPAPSSMAPCPMSHESKCAASSTISSGRWRPLISAITLPEGAFYHFQLVGCEVVTSDGRAVGTVRAVEGEAGNHRLSVEGADGEVLVPLVAPICVSIDVEARRVVIDPPDGLLEVNRKAPGTDR